MAHGRLRALHGRQRQRREGAGGEEEPDRQEEEETSRGSRARVCARVLTSSPDRRRVASVDPLRRRQGTDGDMVCPCCVWWVAADAKLPGLPGGVPSYQRRAGDLIRISNAPTQAQCLV